MASSSNPPPSCLDGASSISSDILKQATQDQNIVEGLHRGFLPGGKAVAVKVCSEAVLPQVLDKLSKVPIHENLVEVIGYGSNGTADCIVYELLPSLNGEFQGLDWDTRVQVALGIARGMDHLHTVEPPMLYGNLNSSKVVLGEGFEAKLLGFGLSEFEKGSEPPYGEPEYVMDSNNLAPKSDVFTVGIILLQLVSGQFAIDLTREPHRINDWAKSAASNKNNLVDPNLEKYNVNQLEMMANLALNCVHASRSNRPTMREVRETMEAVAARKEEKESEEDDDAEDEQEVGDGEQEVGDVVPEVGDGDHCSCCEGLGDVIGDVIGQCCQGLNCLVCGGPGGGATDAGAGAAGGFPMGPHF